MGQREKRTRRLVQLLEKAIAAAMLEMQAAMLAEDGPRFDLAISKWSEVQLLWLQAAQGMSLEKAAIVFTSFCKAGALETWASSDASGPPPTVLSLYGVAPWDEPPKK